MLVVGLTGGIASGKTTVASEFASLYKIPIYIADVRAKELISENAFIQAQIKASFGEKSFVNGEYNRKFIAEIVFSDMEKLKILNGIIHPAVEIDFQNWKKQQQSPYIIKESALLLQLENTQKCDYIIGVFAPLSERIQRLKIRDGMDEQQAISRINSQLNDDFIRKKVDFSIENKNISEIREEIKKIHFYILKKQNII